MRTTTLTITIEARADDSESRIREALMADIDILWQHRHARSTEDGKPVTVTSIEPQESVNRIVKRDASRRAIGNRLMDAFKDK